MKILVVDDEPAVRTLLEFGLPRHGFEVESTDNGFTALQLYKLHRHDVILTDLRHPGLPGEALFVAIRECDPKQLVIFMTAAPWLRDEVAARGLKVLSKPFKMPELIETLSSTAVKKANQ